MEHVSFVLVLYGLYPELGNGETSNTTEWLVGWGGGSSFHPIVLFWMVAKLITDAYVPHYDWSFVVIFLFQKIQIKKGCVSQSYGGLFLSLTDDIDEMP